MLADIKHSELIDEATRLFSKGKYRLTIHAEQERENDLLTMNEIEECFMSGKIEFIEDYPEDPRGHSFLLLGFTKMKRAVHFVCSIHEEALIVITLYEPTSDKWKNYRERIK